MGDVFATIYKAFGIDWTKTHDTPIGRPIKIANSIDDKTGQPVPELVWCAPTANLVLARTIIQLVLGA